MTPTPAELETRLEQTLEAVLSSRRTVTDAARELAAVAAPERTLALRWLDVISATNAELGYHFVTVAGRALAALSAEDFEAWAVAALDVYDRQGLYPATAALGEPEDFAAARRARHRAARLDAERGLLERYLTGLSGRSLQVKEGEGPATDTESVFLPVALERLESAADNRLLYKAMATHLWAINRFGTLRRADPDAPNLGQRLASFRHPRAEALFQALETLRLDACIGRELPGLKREIDRAMPRSLSGIWARAAAELEDPRATVEHTLEWLRKVIDAGAAPPDAAPWQGTVDFAAAATLTEKRLEDDKSELQKLIQDLIDRMDRDDLDLEGDEDAELTLESGDDGDPDSYELVLNGKPLAIPVALREQIDAILQDLEGIPEDWLTLEPGDDDEAGETPEGLEPPEERSGDPVFTYDEWDYQRGHYRKDWCTLYERRVDDETPGFYDATLARHHGVVADLRRSFEMLRDEHRVLRRQPHGEDIDLDAAVEAAADRLLGKEVSNRLFLKTHRQERDIAVMFMVDLSGSTKGWIIDAEKEALVLLCEALEILGDRYGIYGFSGMTRRRCELFRIKRLDEPLGAPVKARIAGLEPRDYTRMGVTIRHLTKLMSEVDARTRLLVTLSDGKPDDYDGYRGDYGIEDTRQALIEARNQGIHPFCITIDKRAGEYLPHMYGAVNYTVVDDVRKLPREVSEVYWRLTR